ncbi:MAG: zinc ribbon domain-containing protein [Sorangiineae bacterium]|nr:zinc ribbon domain-containing protein [Polyangiaceae bacterium]MEB2322388.1 zinc ribbon domain-containing protein [Sorangiineae bacterium]
MSERRLSPTALRAAAIAAGGIAIIVAGASSGLATALLVAAGGTLLAAITLSWGSLQDLSGDAELSLDEALGMAAPSAEEEQKRAVLRALKDLEYERAVGKISEEDYAEFTARYRQEARALLQSLDASEAELRARAQKALEARLSRASEDESADHAAKSSAGERAARKSSAAPPRCPACERPNDADARFCKHCGASLSGEHAASHQEPSHEPEDEATNDREAD